MVVSTFYALVASLLFAITGIAGKFLATQGVTPYLLSFARFASTSIILLPFINRTELKMVTKRHVGYFMLMGLTGILLFNVLFFAALHYTSALSVSLIGATNPMIALILSALIMRKSPSKEQLLALLCAFAGVSIIIMHDASPETAILSGNNFGEFLALAAICSQVCYALLVKQMSSIFSPIFLACVAGVTGLLFLTPFVLQTNFWSTLLALPTSAWLSLLYISTLGGALSAILYIKVIQKLGAALANMILFSTTPIFTGILSLFLLGITPTLWHLAGGSLVFVALMLGLKYKD
jgi:drug/metabolite transporter (DMT)-like permease